MLNAVEKLTDFLLMLGVNNVAFVMFLTGVLYFLPEPIDAIAAPAGPPVVFEASAPSGP